MIKEKVFIINEGTFASKSIRMEEAKCILFVYCCTMPTDLELHIKHTINPIDFTPLKIILWTFDVYYRIKWRYFV